MPQSKETQGWCDGVCGLYDHHLVEGLCPQCRKKFVDYEGEHACDDNYAERAMEDVTQDAYREMLNVEIAA
ncbi:MAG: hypothetical protein SV201_05770 [Pseudomonadota bacterium]|nr:hypothetical protein [Pseudomonadota bacterium]